MKHSTGSCAPSWYYSLDSLVLWARAHRHDCFHCDGRGRERGSTDNL